MINIVVTDKQVKMFLIKLIVLLVVSGTVGLVLGMYWGE